MGWRAAPAGNALRRRTRAAVQEHHEVGGVLVHDGEVRGAVVVEVGGHPSVGARRRARRWPRREALDLRERRGRRPCSGPELRGPPRGPEGGAVLRRHVAGQQDGHDLSGTERTFRGQGDGAAVRGEHERPPDRPTPPGEHVQRPVEHEGVAAQRAIEANRDGPVGGGGHGARRGGESHHPQDIRGRGFRSPAATSGPEQRDGDRPPEPSTHAPMLARAQRARHTPSRWRPPGQSAGRGEAAGPAGTCRRR